jgi:hypothetical protein
MAGWDIGAFEYSLTVSGVEFTPSPITASFSGVDPTIVLGSISFTPPPITVSVSGVEPFVIAGGNVIVTPAFSTVSFSGIDPTVVLGSISFTPSPITVSVSGIDPTVVAGGDVIVTPAFSTVSVNGIDPTIVLGSISFTPPPITVSVSGVEPFVIAGGNVIVTPDFATVSSDGVDPIIVLESISFTPSPITVSVSGIDPTIFESDLVITPAAATVSVTGVDPTVFLGSTSYAPSPITTAATGNDPFDVVVHAGFTGLFWTPIHPNPVEGLSFNEVGDSLEITWPVVASGVSNEYEVWSSVGDQNNYNLVGIVNNIEIPSGSEYVTIVDKSYEAITTVYYKIYHKSTDYFSTPLESGIALTYSVPDPTNLEVSKGLNQLALSWTNNDSRLLEATSITHMSAVDPGDLVEISGVEIFLGLAAGYNYEVTTAGIELWHQFWVSSVTRTTL